MRLILMAWKVIKNSRGILSLAFGTLKTARHENLASVWEKVSSSIYGSWRYAIL